MAKRTPSPKGPKKSAAPKKSAQPAGPKATKKAAAPKKPAESKGPKKAASRDGARLYTLEVFLLGGNMSEKFARTNREISRTILIRGDQTLQDLHRAIFDAFDRWEEHMYEFQFGKEPMDPEGPRYVLPGFEGGDPGEDNPPAGRVDRVRIDSLGLEIGRIFGYWFDFGDDWWHQINVEAIEGEVPSGKYPKVSKRVGKSPPQYPEEDE